MVLWEFYHISPPALFQCKIKKCTLATRSMTSANK